MGATNAMTQKIRTPLEAQAIKAVLKEEFDFLTSVGYEVTTDGPDTAVLSNGQLSLTFDIELGSYVVMSEIQCASTGERFTLYSALANLVPTAAQDVACNGRDIDSFRQCVRRLSSLCRQYLFAVFMGDEAAFAMMATAAHEIEHKHTLEYEYGAIVDRANTAWEEKQWKKAQELYESAQPALSKMEANRLTFLQKKNNEPAP
jgi:hypothetical protein